MVVVRTILPTSVGDEVRYLATESSLFVFASAVASTHFGAIIACLKSFNEQIHYDESYNV